MKKFIIISLALLIWGCEKNETLLDDGTVIWKPNPVATIDNNQIQLNWLNYSIYNNVLLPYTFVEPDNFEIYVSKGSTEGFTKVIELKNGGDYSYQIKNLTNGQPYYFYVVSKKKRYLPLLSDTIMAIPNPQPNTETLITSNNSHTIASVSLSPQKNKIAYVDKSYSWNGGENCCSAVAILTSNLDGSETKLLGINASEPCWSPDNNKIVFRLETDDMQIATYNIESKNIAVLTNENDEKYAPVFSKNGDFILFESPKNSNVDYPGDTPTNIWMINANTSEATKITDIASLNLKKAGRPNWIDNENFLFHGTNRKYKSQIYESSAITKQVTQKIVSAWNDYCPSISPDNRKIAFISDRSGSDQIWLYSMDNNSLKQLTGFPSLGGVDRWWNRIEWTDNSNILFTLGDSKLVKLKIE